MHNLVELNLSRNNLEKFACPLRKLQKLDLSHNRLTSVSSLKQLTSLRELSLAGNESLPVRGQPPMQPIRRPCAHTNGTNHCCLSWFGMCLTSQLRFLSTTMSPMHTGLYEIISRAGPAWTVDPRWTSTNFLSLQLCKEHRSPSLDNTPYSPSISPPHPSVVTVLPGHHRR